MARQSWSKEEILVEVRRRLEANDAESPRKANPSLYNAARYHFGSWENAVAASRDRGKRQRWTKERIIEQIRYRRAHHQRLDPYTMRQEDQALYGAARYHFGSWSKAIEAAGIPYYRARRKTVRRSPSGTWSREKVLQEIRRLSEGGPPPRLGEAILHHSRLKAAAEYYFGSWRKACDAAQP